jgi:hypothetical protein
MNYVRNIKFMQLLNKMALLIKMGLFDVPLHLCQDKGTSHSKTGCLITLRYGHGRNVRDTMKECILQMGTDKMIPRNMFHKLLTVRFTDRSAWERGSIPIKKRDTHLVYGWVQDKRRHWCWGVWPWHKATVQLLPRAVNHSIPG